MTEGHSVARYNLKVGIPHLLTAFVLCAQMGALAQAPAVTITLVRWPFT
jgi:hypothetical protein